MSLPFLRRLEPRVSALPRAAETMSMYMRGSWVIVATAFPLSTGVLVLILVLVRGRWFKTLLQVKPALQKHNLENRSLEQFENQWG